MIAPVNQGSQLAKVQTIMQISKGLKAINGKDATKAMLSLSDGLGQAAEDMLPGSKFLKVLNRRPRRAGVAYHILAGDRGFLTREGREQIEGRLELVTQNAGIFGRLTRAATADLPELLDELTDGKGDGCIAVERTRLEGVADHVVIHANHVELVRGPLLYPEPGPVVCMPMVLKWLKADRRKATRAIRTCAVDHRDRTGPGSWDLSRACVNLVARQGIESAVRSHLPEDAAHVANRRVQHQSSKPLRTAGHETTSERPLHPLCHRDVGAIRLLHGCRDR